MGLIKIWINQHAVEWQDCSGCQVKGEENRTSKVICKKIYIYIFSYF